MKKILCAAISLCLALFIMLCLCFCGYSNKIVACEEVVNSLTASEVGLPAGKIYSASASEGEEGYIPDSLINSLFGGGVRMPLFDGWIDYAFFMPSSAHPCEIVVILCDTPVTAKDTARLLCRRLNTIKAVKGDGEINSPTSSTASPDTAHLDLSVYPDTAHLYLSAYLDSAHLYLSASPDTVHLDVASYLDSVHLDVASYLDNAEVVISRNYVLLIISSDTAAAKKTALALIG